MQAANPRVSSADAELLGGGWDPPGVSVMVMEALSPAHKINYESDDEYRPETDVHKHLRWYFRFLIAAQARQPVGTLPHLTQVSWECLLCGEVLQCVRAYIRAEAFDVR